MKNIGLCLITIFLFSCSQKEQEKGNALTYFDLKGYFKGEANRLNQTNRIVDKSVAINGSATQKKVKIEDFKKEFSTFMDADINKASWRGSFQISKTPNLIAYKSTDQKIPVKKLEIALNNNKISSIQIFVTNNNILYTSKDTLSYFPDSLYEIKKTQKIKLMAAKNYRISGKY